MKPLIVKVPWTHGTRPSRKLLRACAAFGLALDERAPSRQESASRTIERLERARRDAQSTSAGQCLLLLGPSGCGKSTLLRALALRARQNGTRVIKVRPPRASNRPIIDLVRGSTARAIAALSRAGLADAMLLSRRLHELSDGERARLSLAIALSKARAAPRRSPVLIIADEFASVLDRHTARSVARSIARFIATTPGVDFAAASPHDDVEACLEPDVLARGELGRRSDSKGNQPCDWTITTRSPSPKEPTPTISPSNDSIIEPRPRRRASASFAPPTMDCSRGSSSSRCPRSTDAGATSPGRASAHATSSSR